MSPRRARVGRLLVVRAFASASGAPWAPARASASGAYAPLQQRGLDDLEGANLDDPVILADDAEVH